MKYSEFLLLAATLLGSTLIGCDRQPTVDEPSVPTQDEQKSPRGKATQYGLFHGLDKGRVEQSPNTSTGHIIRGSKVEFAETTTRIPLRQGVLFGYRYWLKFPPDQKRPKLKRVLIHPEMHLPDGSRVTRSERVITRKATHGIVASLDVYALSEDYELVEGEWTFQIWHQDQLLVEQTFVSYRPGTETTSEQAGSER